LVLLSSADQASYLGTGQHHRALLRHNTRDAVRDAASKLAAALREELGPLHSNSPGTALVSSARSRLNDEAKRLETEDALGANLLRSYAQYAPATVLLLPLTDDFMTQDDFFGGADRGLYDDTAHDAEAQQSTSETEETVFSSKNGRSVTLRTHCKDGDCVQEKTIGHSPKLGRRDGVRMPSQMQESPSQMQGSNSVSSAAREMANSMRAIEKIFGNSDFQDILRHGFDLDANGSGNAQTRDTEIASTPYEVSSTVTRIDGNGHMVTNSKTCKDGKCATQVVEKQIGDAAKDQDIGQNEWPAIPVGGGAAENRAPAEEEMPI